jgi:hypothetical protein
MRSVVRKMGPRMEAYKAAGETAMMNMPITSSVPSF